MPNLAGYDAGLPANVDAEKTILGALLLDNSRLLEIAAALNPDDFSLDSHKRIFAAMLTLNERDSTIDIVTLPNELTRKKEINGVGGWSYVTSLTDGLPRRPEIEAYIAIVKDKSLLRKIAVVTTQITARALDQGETALEVLASAEFALASIAESGHTSEIYDSADLAIEAEEKLVNHPADSPAIPTGIAALDEWTTGGIREDELWVIGAPPSRGKTTLARQIIANAISRGIPSYVQSGEMSRQSWFNITACLLDGLPTLKLREPKLMNLTERENMRAAIRRAAELPLAVSDPGGIHIDRLIYNAKRQKDKNGIRIFAVDYAQIVKAPGRDKKDQVSEVADKMRLFAHDEKVATILLSQLARPEGRNINARPNMYALKESGRLEEAADTALLLYRPVDTDKDEFTGADEIIIGKQRNGLIGHVPVYLNGKFLRFEGRQ